MYLGEHHALALNPVKIPEPTEKTSAVKIPCHTTALCGYSMGSTSFANQQNDAQDY